MGGGGGCRGACVAVWYVCINNVIAAMYAMCMYVLCAVDRVQDLLVL